MMNDHTARPRNRWRRLLLPTLIGLGATGLMLLPAATAAAHVRVSSDNPTSGGFSALTFRVPNESGTAGTTKLTVELPTDTPFLYVSTKPVPGWTATTTKTKLDEPVESYGTTLTEAVSQVSWTADRGAQIRPGEYQEFSISVGPLPEPGTVLLPAIQTYSDGTVVAWDEPMPASGEEPEHPAPVIDVVAADEGADPHGSASTEETPAATDSEQQPGGADPIARALGGVGLVAGTAALALAGVALRRSGGSGPSA
jgi:uncharacterized protein YcnI